MTGASRDIGLKSSSAGKGDAPRNIGPKFYENFEAINFGYSLNQAFNVDFEKGFKRMGNKLRKTYK